MPRVKVMTTVNPVNEPVTQPAEKQEASSDAQKMYAAYVRGDSLQKIADSFKEDVQVVLETVQQIEANR